MRVLWITLFIVLIDQTSKYVVLQTMSRGQSIPILGDWLKLTFTENPGMAFGITFGPKSMVTIFAILATALIIFYLSRVRMGYLPYRASLALILGGALGNIIDRVFYGVLLGYDTFFVGKVVDFIHVNLWSGIVPDAVPLLGGMYLSLFPIWNVADMAIVCGVVGILLFQKTYHDQLVAAYVPGQSGEAEEGYAGDETLAGDRSAVAAPSYVPNEAADQPLEEPRTLPGSQPEPS